MNKSLALLLILALSCSTLDIAGGKTPAVSNESNNMEPSVQQVTGNVFKEVIRVPEAGNAGNALYLKGNNLYVGSGDRIMLFDVSVPDTPRLRSECTILGSVRQLVADDRAVYATTRGSGLHIVDVSNPDCIKYVKRYDTIELATGIDVAGDVLFVTLRSYGVEFIDIRDILHPQHIYLQKTAESQSCWYQNGYLYSGEWGKALVTTINASDMSNISVACTKELLGNGDGLSTLENRLYASTGHHAKNGTLTGDDATGMGHGLEIFDISDPASPRFISRVQFDRLYKRGAGDWWTVRPSADGKMLFVADTFNGLYAVDASNEAKPVVAGRIFMQKSDGSSDAGTYVSSVAVGDGVVYATGQSYGLFLVKCKGAKKVERDLGTLPANSQARYPYNTPASSHFKAWKPDARCQVRSLAVADNEILLAACSDGGLYVLKNDPSTGLYQIGKGNMAFAGDVSVRNGRVYVTEGAEGVGVYTISSDGVLSEIARMTDFGNEKFNLPLWVNAVSDRYLIVNDRKVGDIVVDMKDFPVMKPVLTHHLGTTWWDKYIACEVAPNGWLGASVVAKGMSWINLNGTPANSKLDKSINTSSACAPFRDGTVIVNVKNRLTQLQPGVVPAKEIASVKGNFKGTPVWDGGNLLAINFRHGKEFKKVDVTTVEGAKILWTEVLEGNPDRAIFWNGKILVPAGYQGILIEK